MAFPFIQRTAGKNVCVVEVGFLATILYFFSNAVLVIDEESTVFTATQVLATPSHPGTTLLFQWLLFVQQLQIVC